ncbi:hypothetical protein FRZ44_49190 [Hypericibacter terrae]|uniref:Serine protease n=1 Tax=Hypericibacter terrae TaxID=2602015 RepID=A0A5J6MQC4_9PROT|nr:hypothetical protein [Hypericibacter terrae]QEX19604.1 hypothetical protein FRZ44_49190 [Hypericibacter terrae]
MVGEKMDPEELCLTVLVANKIAKSDLKVDDRLPRYVRHEGKTIPVDVVRLRRLKPQVSVFPDPGPVAIKVGDASQGTIGALCSVGGQFFALTCGHVVPNASFENIAYSYSPGSKTWIPIGKTHKRIISPDTDGFVDAALIALEHPELIVRASHATFLEFGMPMGGQQLLAHGASHGICHGVVSGLHAIITDAVLGTLYCDALINVSSPGTFGGDSGMLWKDSDGRAVAMHSYGEGAGGSRKTAAMLASRAAAALTGVMPGMVRLLSVPN